MPADAMAVYFGRPSPESADAGGAVQRLSGWMLTLKAMGVIPREGRVIADLLGSVTILGRRPHALVLLDVTSRKMGPQMYRLNTLHAAMLIDSRGNAAELDRRIRDLLSTYTDAAHGRIEPLRSGDLAYHRLIDSRLPEWSIIEWGMVGDLLLITFGAGAFEQMLATMQGERAALARDDWFKLAHDRCRGADSGIEVFINLKRIRERVGEVVQGRPEEVLRALELHEADRLLWTVGYDGRALRSEVLAHLIDGTDEYIMLTGPQVTAPEVTAAIPTGASSYAAFRFDIPEAVLRVRQAWLESQSPETQERLISLWSRLEQQFEFQAEADLISRLGDHVVFHTFPPHPLRLPGLCTIWVRLSGDTTGVRATIDAMMRAWQDYLSGDLQARPAVGLSPAIRQDPDGVWFLQLGFLGPALAVADGWIVISYSPEAVRQNLALLTKIAK